MHFKSLFILVCLLSGIAFAANWTAAMKTHSEMLELLNSSQGHNNDNMIESLTVADVVKSKYVVKSTKCLLSVNFNYLQSDPEKKILRKMNSITTKGPASICDSFFATNQ